MSTLLDNLLSNGTVNAVHGGFKCGCSENIIQKSSIRTHVNTKKHLRWINGDMIPPRPVPTEDGIISEEKDECPICYEIRGKFFKCTCCSQIHCMDCHSQINTCPFCRTRFKVVPKRVIQEVLIREERVFFSRDGTYIGSIFTTALEARRMMQMFDWVFA
jgi:hypothetical protein